MSYFYINAAEALLIALWRRDIFYSRYFSCTCMQASGLLNTRACPNAHQDGDVAQQALIAHIVR
jgi:hypothetical protein